MISRSAWLGLVLPLSMGSRRIEVTYTLLDGTACLSSGGKYPISYWQQGGKVSPRSTSPSPRAPVLTFGRAHDLPQRSPSANPATKWGGCPPPVDHAPAF